MGKIARTAQKSAARMPREAEPAPTTTQMIVELRNLRAGALFVGNMDYVDALLGAYDELLDNYEKLLGAYNRQNITKGETAPVEIAGSPSVRAPLYRCGACGGPAEGHEDGPHGPFVPNVLA